MNERILLVDDEDDIRLVVRRMLEAKGYVVMDARDPHHALRIAGREPIDLLLTDVIMPMMRGTELAQRVRALVPSAKVLLMSAYKIAEITESQLPFIAKPFTPEALTDKVGQLLRPSGSPFNRRPPARPGSP